MIIEDQKYLTPFQDLLDLATEKAKLPSVPEWKKGDRDNLSRKIRQHFGGRFEIASSTFRDYRYQYLENPNYDFSFSSEKMDILSEYLGFNSWIDFCSSYELREERNEVTATETIKKQSSYQVFVCYNHRDENFVRKLSQDLAKYGISCWLYSDQLITGDETHLKISKNLRESCIVLAVISKNSIGSRWVQKELSWSLSNEMVSDGFRIMPLVIDGSTIPFFLSDRQYADFARGYENTLNKLTNDILRILHPTDSNKVLIGDNITIKYSASSLGAKGLFIIIVFLALAMTAISIGVQNVPDEISQIALATRPIFLFSICFAIAELFRIYLVMTHMNRDAVFAREYSSLHGVFLIQRPFWAVMSRHWRKPVVFMILVFHLLIAAGMWAVVYGFIMWVRRVFEYATS